MVVFFIPHAFFVFVSLQVRAGSHDNIPMKPVDPSAFSHSKRIDRPDPQTFVKRGEGNGGTMVPRPKPVLTSAEIAQNEIRSKQSKLLTHPAVCRRSNPPNTELRRYVLASLTHFFTYSVTIVIQILRSRRFAYSSGSWRSGQSFGMEGRNPKVGFPPLLANFL
jgi:hypothetical protein